jgi:hypothetical protein
MPANPAWSRLCHDAPLDRVDPLRPAAGGAALRLIVADGDIDALVIDRALLVVRARVEKRAPNRMLPADGSDRPAQVSVTVSLRDRKFARRVPTASANYRG